MSHSSPYKDRHDWPWDCRLVKKVVLKPIQQCFPWSMRIYSNAIWHSTCLRKNTYTELYTGSFHVRNHLVSNHCHLKIKWLHNVISETKVKWGGRYGDGGRNLNGNIMSEKESLWMFKKIRWMRKINKEHFNRTLLI